MKKVERFVNEISKEEYSTKKEAIISENKSRDIQEAFSFYYENKIQVKDGNDEIGVQRDEEFYYKLIDTLIEMVKKYESWILESNYAKTGFLREKVQGYSFLGRFLDDSQSSMYHWWQIQGNICSKCYKEYGQMYFALQCCKED